jgi:ribosomal protein S5
MVRATMQGLQQLERPEQVAAARGKNLAELRG